MFHFNIKKMLKNDTTSFNDLNFIMKFTGTYFGKFLPKDYILGKELFLNLMMTAYLVNILLFDHI